MADLVIRGYIGSTDATNEPRSIWVGSDLLVRLRLANEPIPETSEPSDLLERDDIAEISYKVYREVDGVAALVEGYESVPVDIDAAIPLGLPRTWGKDGVGYNFRHVVPAEAFAANCLHRVVYRFLVDDVTTLHPVTVSVDGPAGDVGSAGTGTVTGNPGPPGLDGEDGLPGADGGAALLFCQTQTVTVSNLDTEQTLIGTGPGTNEIPADSQLAGNVYTFNAGGLYSTKATAPGDALFKFKLGSELTLTFPKLLLLGARSNARWDLVVRVVRRTIGGSGVVVANGKLIVQDAGQVVSLAGSGSTVTLPTDAIKTPNITIEWDTADVGNAWAMQEYTIKKENVAA